MCVLCLHGLCCVLSLVCVRAHVCTHIFVWVVGCIVGGGGEGVRAAEKVPANVKLRLGSRQTYSGHSIWQLDKGSKFEVGQAGACDHVLQVKQALIGLKHKPAHTK